MEVKKVQVLTGHQRREKESNEKLFQRLRDFSGRLKQLLRLLDNPKIPSSRQEGRRQEVRRLKSARESVVTILHQRGFRHGARYAPRNGNYVRLHVPTDKIEELWGEVGPGEIVVHAQENSSLQQVLTIPEVGELGGRNEEGELLFPPLKLMPAVAETVLHS